jgi:glycosyltransferase involved in cell wall biosynthesis
MTSNRRLRIALYHNLPKGGARRLLVELVARSSDVHEYDLYELAGTQAVDTTQSDASEDASIAAHPALAGRLARVTTERWGSRSRHVLSPITRVRDLASADAHIAGAIDSGGYDLAVVFPCRFRQAPDVLAMLATPSLYYAPEPRRRSVEAAYDPTWRPAVAARRPALPSLAAGWSRHAHERYLAARDRRAVASAHHVAACSASAAERFWMAYGRDAMVSPPGVDELVFRPAPPLQTEESGPGSLVTGRAQVVAVGALDPTKGHELAIEALALLPTGVRPDLTIVHERLSSGYDTYLLGRAAAAGVALQLVRGISDAELVARYRDADATLALARVEPFGLSVIESLACGTPVVALNEGGYRETVVDGVNGRLVERSPSAVAASVGTLTARPSTFPVDQIVASVVPRYTWTAASERFLEVLDRSIAESLVGR